jgi:phosphoglycolate phosphatase-like HAD superfamily hydrolase
MTKKLVLLDIDGTILNSSGTGRMAMEAALTKVFGTAGADGYHYDGKTDKQIVRESMRLAGIDEATIDARMDDAIAAYLDGLRALLGSGTRNVRLFEGVSALIDAIDAREDAILGLLTGNVEDGARLKLGSVGIPMDKFHVNAFGSDHETRGELPAIAHRRMCDAFGVTLDGRDVIVIGDTPADIDCGRGIGARAIAVATGRYSVDELRAHDPFAAFETLGDTAAVLAAIDADTRVDTL